MQVLWKNLKLKLKRKLFFFQYITVFEIKLLDPTTNELPKQACSFILSVQATLQSTFLKYNSSVSCGGSGSTQVNRDPTSVKNKLISYGNLCTAGVQKDTDDGEKCGKQENCQSFCKAKLCFARYCSAGHNFIVIQHEILSPAKIKCQLLIGQ